MNENKVPKGIESNASIIVAPKQDRKSRYNISFSKRLPNIKGNDNANYEWNYRINYQRNG